MVLALLIAVLRPSAASGSGSEKAAQQPGEVGTLFAAQCAACHGAAGVPNAAMAQSMGIPSFLDAHGVTAKPDSVLRASVTAGKGKMPAFRGRLTPGQISSLVTYVKSLRQRRAR